MRGCHALALQVSPIAVLRALVGDQPSSKGFACANCLSGAYLALGEVEHGVGIRGALDVVCALIFAEEARIHVQARVRHGDYLVKNVPEAEFPRFKRNGFPMPFYVARQKASGFRTRQTMVNVRDGLETFLAAYCTIREEGIDSDLGLPAPGKLSHTRNQPLK